MDISEKYRRDLVPSYLTFDTMNIYIYQFEFLNEKEVVALFYLYNQTFFVDK